MFGIGMSPAVIQGLREMQRPPEKIRYVVISEAEFRISRRLAGVDPIEIDIAVKMMKAGAYLDGGDGLRITLSDAEESAQVDPDADRDARRAELAAEIAKVRRESREGTPVNENAEQAARRADILACIQETQDAWNRYGKSKY